MAADIGHDVASAAERAVAASVAQMETESPNIDVDLGRYEESHAPDRPEAYQKIDSIGTLAGADLVAKIEKPAVDPLIETPETMTPEQVRAAIKGNPDQTHSDFRESAAEALKGNGGVPGESNFDWESFTIGDRPEVEGPDFGQHLQEGATNELGNNLDMMEPGTADTHPGLNNPRATVSEDDAADDAAPKEEEGFWDKVKDAVKDVILGLAGGAANASNTAAGGTAAGGALTVLTANGDPESKSNEFKGWATFVNLSKGKHPHQDQLDQVDYGDGGSEPKQPDSQDQSPDAIDPKNIRIDFTDPNWLIKVAAEKNGEIQYADMPESGDRGYQEYDGIDYGAYHTEPENIPDDALAVSIWDDPAVDPNRN